MQVKYLRFVNTHFTSNTYILYVCSSADVWLVDPGDMQPIWQWMQENGKTNVNGILLTHSHFDHCYGVNDVLERYPKSLLFIANEQGKLALKNPKLNHSYFTGHPFAINAENNLQYFFSEYELWNGVILHTLFTPGHSDDSVCFWVERLLFSGDTLIHNLRTVTKLRGGNPDKLPKSLSQLKTLQGENYHVCPGHNEEFDLDGYDLDIAMQLH